MKFYHGRSSNLPTDIQHISLDKLGFRASLKGQYLVYMIRKWRKKIYRKDTYPCKAIHPTWYAFSGELVAYILAEMVAVFDNQVISITAVIRSLVLHEISNLVRIQMCGTNAN